MNILVLCDDHWHPARTPRAGLIPLEGPDFHFDWIENAAAWSRERMEQYALVILTKSNNVSSADESNWMTPAVEEAFAGYVEKGRGLLVIHSGLAGYSQTPVLRALMGGVFTQHPAQCLVSIEPAAEHVLTLGAGAFTALDEHYFVTDDDPARDVFLNTRSENGLQPGGWTRRQGSGRVCILSPGHNPEVWLHPSFQALLRNALLWCGKPA